MDTPPPTFDIRHSLNSSIVPFNFWLQCTLFIPLPFTFIFTQIKGFAKVTNINLCQILVEYMSYVWKDLMQRFSQRTDLQMCVLFWMLLIITKPLSGVGHDKFSSRFGVDISYSLSLDIHPVTSRAFFMETVYNFNDFYPFPKIWFLVRFLFLHSTTLFLFQISHFQICCHDDLVWPYHWAARAFSGLICLLA